MWYNKGSEVRDMRKVLDAGETDAKFSFGILLRAIRKTLGFTQEELSKKVGISRQMINYYETFQSAPKIAHGEMLAKVLSKAIERKVKQ